MIEEVVKGRARYVAYLAKYEALYDVLEALDKCKDMECIDRLRRVLEDLLDNLEVLINSERQRRNYMHYRIVNVGEVKVRIVAKLRLET